MFLFALAFAADAPTPLAVYCDNVALLPSGDAVVAAAGRGLVRIDLATGSPTPVPQTHDGTDAFQVLHWTHTDDAVRIVSSHGLFDVRDEGPAERLPREAPAGDVHAMSGDRLAYTLWADEVLHVDGWDDVPLGDDPYPTSAAFTPDGQRLYLVSHQSLRVIEASGVVRTQEDPYIQHLALVDDEPLLAHGTRVNHQDDAGKVQRSYAMEPGETFAVHGDRLFSDDWLDLDTGVVEETLDLEQASADSHGGRLVVLGRPRQGAVTLWTADPGETTLREVWRSGPAVAEVHIVGQHVFLIDGAGDVHRFTDGQRDAFVDVLRDGGAIHYAFRPDGRRFVRCGSHGLASFDVTSGERLLQVPSPSHCGVFAHEGGWLVFDDGFTEHRGDDLQVAERVDDDALLFDHRGPWASLGDDRWRHGATGQTRKVADAVWNGTDLVQGRGYSTRAAGAWSVFVRDDNQLEVREGAKVAWTLPGIVHPDVAAIDDTGRVYLLDGSSVQIWANGALQRVLYLLPDGWAAWHDGELEAHGDTRGLR